MVMTLSANYAHSDVSPIDPLQSITALRAIETLPLHRISHSFEIEGHLLISFPSCRICWSVCCSLS